MLLYKTGLTVRVMANYAVVRGMPYSLWYNVLWHETCLVLLHIMLWYETGLTDCVMVHYAVV